MYLKQKELFFVSLQTLQEVFTIVLKKFFIKMEEKPDAMQIHGNTQICLNGILRKTLG